MMLARVKLYGMVAGICLATVLAVALIWRAWLIDGERARAAADAARGFQETMDRMGDADVGTGDADDDLRWLERRLHEGAGQR